MPSTRPRSLDVAIDIGGTFTDVTLLDRRDGRVWRTKTVSTPQDQSRGFMTGIEKVLDIAGADLADIGRILHATTVATNLILEGKGASAALITSSGFRHVLEIGRHDIPEGANPHTWIKPERPVPPERIHEVGGRIDKDGIEIQPLDEAALRIIARTIAAERIGSVAVCLLNAYASPAHELRTGEILAEELPGVIISLSSQILPVFREYERSMVTILNAYVAPAVSGYVGNLERRITEKGIEAPLLLMKSNGGVASARTICSQPVQTALSGPAAGVIGASFFGKLAGYPNIIGIDIGGTSADIAVIGGGQPNMSHESRIADWPLALPMIEIHTIGAGGGSIATVSNGVLKVGPSSAGSEPGPVSYGRGGSQPTVTDAHVVLGHLPLYLMNGEMALDVEGARQAIADAIAAPLGLSPVEAARGILTVANEHMKSAIRLMSVERGLDPRDFALMPFGGAGPLHGSALARLLGIRTIVLPPAPGVLSAMGLLVSQMRSEYSRTLIQSDQPDLPRIQATYAELEGEGRAWLRNEAIPEEAQTITRTADLRYRNQGFELSVVWQGNTVTDETLAATLATFHEEHRRVYSFDQPDTPVEIVTLRLAATGTQTPPDFKSISAGLPAKECIVGHSLIELDDGPADCPIYDREQLRAGATVRGPAILRQMDTTILVLPGQTGRVNAYGTMVVTEDE